MASVSKITWQDSNSYRVSNDQKSHKQSTLLFIHIADLEVKTKTNIKVMNQTFIWEQRFIIQWIIITLILTAWTVLVLWKYICTVFRENIIVACNQIYTYYKKIHLSFYTFSCSTESLAVFHYFSYCKKNPKKHTHMKKTTICCPSLNTFWLPYSVAFNPKSIHSWKM